MALPKTRFRQTCQPRCPEYNDEADAHKWLKTLGSDLLNSISHSFHKVKGFIYVNVMNLSRKIICFIYKKNICEKGKKVLVLCNIFLTNGNAHFKAMKPALKALSLIFILNLLQLLIHNRNQLLPCSKHFTSKPLFIVGNNRISQRSRSGEWAGHVLTKCVNSRDQVIKKKNY